MKTTTLPIVASVDSRLQADVIIVRLRRVGIPCDRIWAAFSRRRVPNAVACWLGVVKKPILYTEHGLVFTAGQLSAKFSDTSRGVSLVALLEKAGYEHSIACRMKERLEQGYILISVQGASEAETSLAWHVFDHSMAEILAVGEGDEAERPVPAGAEFYIPPVFPSVAA
jgi:hypothetical protein